jgi:hypothetical protein
MVDGWARSNCRQVVLVCRAGAGGIRCRVENAADRRGPHAVTELEQLALNSLGSPLGFSRARRSIRTTTALSTGG